MDCRPAAAEPGSPSVATADPEPFTCDDAVSVAQSYAVAIALAISIANAFAVSISVADATAIPVAITPSLARHNWCAAVGQLRVRHSRLAACGLDRIWG
jgi:hypothetical protein